MENRLPNGDNNQFILVLSSVLLYGGYSYMLELLVIIIDLILVCNFYKGNGWLFFSTGFPFVLSDATGKHVQREEGVGVLCTYAWVVAIVYLGVFSFKDFSSYGALLIEEDAKMQAETTILLEQMDENGYSCGEMMKDKIRFGDSELESRGETEIFTLWGHGRVTIEHNSFVLLEDYQVETPLEFTKK